MGNAEPMPSPVGKASFPVHLERGTIVFLTCVVNIYTIWQLSAMRLTKHDSEAASKKFSELNTVCPFDPPPSTTHARSTT